MTAVRSPVDARAAVRAELDRYLTLFPDDATRLVELRNAVASGGDVLARTHHPGHVTASALVVHRGRLLLVQHVPLGRWLQPGGHLERCELPRETARREALEETGLESLTLADWHVRHDAPLDVDTHHIPSSGTGGPAHVHHDFRYVFTTAGGPLRLPRREVSAARWVDTREAAELGAGERLLARLAAVAGEKQR